MREKKREKERPWCHIAQTKGRNIVESEGGQKTMCGWTNLPGSFNHMGPPRTKVGGNIKRIWQMMRKLGRRKGKRGKEKGNNQKGGWGRGERGYHWGKRNLWHQDDLGELPSAEVVGGTKEKTRRRRRLGRMESHGWMGSLVIYTMVVCWGKKGGNKDEEIVRGRMYTGALA